MSKPKIVAYLKPTCGWSQGVRAVLKKYDLPYEDRDVINDPLQRQEMIEKSGQMLSPCVEINGHMLPDISGEEVEAWMLANNIVTQNNIAPDAPINQLSHVSKQCGWTPYWTGQRPVLPHLPLESGLPACTIGESWFSKYRWEAENQRSFHFFAYCAFWLS